MKLLALHLTNVRKFTGKRASITGIGGGITVVSEANEFGKSTFFDAIHALFFEKFSSAAKPVKSLQPYAGGAVEVAAEVETDQGAFRIEKRFLTGKRAKVTRQSDGAIIAQDDEAERWIATLLGSDGHGPAGLLWVRQGLVGLEPDTAKEKTVQVETRRDLLSSVAGEIDAMTGGRRMDRVMRRVADDLAKIATKTMRRTGDWKAAADEVAQLEQELESLTEQLRQLDTALSARKQAEAMLARLDDPEAKARREAARTAAQTAMDAASAYSQKMRTARQAQELAELHARNATTDLTTFVAAQDALTLAQAAAAKAKSQVTEAEETVKRLNADRVAAQTHQESTAHAIATIRARLDTGRHQIEARKASAEALRLSDLIAKADADLARRDKAVARLKASPATQAWLTRVEAADADFQTLQATVQAQSTTLVMTYTGPTRLTLNGAPVAADHPIALDSLTEIDIPGIGQMSLRAPSSGGDAKDRLEKARALLADLLAEAGAETVQDARALAANRSAADRDASTAMEVLAMRAPDGIDALRIALAEATLAAGSADDTPLPDLAQMEAQRDAAIVSDEQARSALTIAMTAHAEGREALVRAQASAASARQGLDRALAAAGPDDTRDDRRGTLLRQAAQADAALADARAAMTALTADAPDQATAAAELKRATDAIDTAAAQRAQTDKALTGYSSTIRALAGNGIEERCSELEGALDAARATEAGFARQAKALKCLADALEAERKAARDTYFGPVQAELKPLLAILHGNAALSFDSDSLLPSGLLRDQTEETLDDLSGGTREQIAILTRMAFARLFAKQGRHMPIVLDDALVYSDDDRIIKMFTALTRVAQDQQILVFSCRQLAFQDLGGSRPRVEICDA